ncbi:MAG: MlaD family protein [Terriglobales bacterium]|jgi:phospholipid/cholesterol/gamma-HCH transport system substrate-binding protein
MMLCRLLTTLPSQKQLKWSKLRVGLTVIFASATLGVLIFAMSGTGGWFTSKITLHSYFDNAQGLREGAPVRLAGVDIGNVKSVKIVGDKPLTPVEVTMKVNTKYASSLRKDSVTLLTTAGVLGETYVDMDSSQSKGPLAVDGDTLETREAPQIQDVVRASQGTLQNMDSLLKRVDRIMTFIESGQGSIGKLIYSQALYDQLNATVAEFKSLVDDVQSGKGSLGPLFTSDEAYKKAMAAINQLNAIVDEIQEGKGSAGKLLKDPTLFDNANKTVANMRQLTDDINAGKGTLGRLSHDQEFADKLKITMNNLAALSERLEKGEGTVGKLFQDPTLYNNSNDMLVEVRALLKAIRENPKKYLTFHVKIF